ncbi:MAG: hypothetical protein WC979_09755 [Candidatus Pacearchaeota archaeon]
MGVHILHDKETNYCCLYCSTSMWAFGNIMYSYEEAESFLEWLGIDPRKLTDKELETKYYDFRKEVWDVKQD